MQKIDKMRPKKMIERAAYLRKISGCSFFSDYNEQFVDVKCQACNSNGIFRFKKFGFEHYECIKCKTLFVTPRPNEQLLFTYYNEYEVPRFWTKLLLDTDSERKKL